jgi:RNA polymerase sigma-70 factor (ECF subfamily)
LPITRQRWTSYPGIDRDNTIMDENNLIAQAKKGDLDSFNRLIISYQDMAFNLAYRILWDEDTAEDAAQAGFISAYKNLGNYRGGSFRAWLLRIVKNCCYDELRRSKRHPTVGIDPINKEQGEEIDSPPWLEDSSPGPERSLEMRELELAIQNCVKNLPEEFRTVLTLVDMDEMDYSEVSITVGKPLGTIKSRVARGRARLKDCLNQFRELLPEKYRLGEENRI